MGSSEKFCLRWNDFEGKVSRSFASLRDHSQFFDCTLATDNDEAYSDSLRAHKVVLSACSEFFRNLLTRESMCAHPNPLIYLGGISARDLKYALDFMYHGEVNVARDELDKFLEVSEILKIEGLTKSSNTSKTSKRPATSEVSPSHPVGESHKKVKMQSSFMPSSPMTTAEPRALIKAECNALVAISAEDLEESMRGYDNIGEDSSGINEVYEKEFEKGNEAENDMNDDNQPKNENRGVKNGKTNGEEAIGGKGKHIPETERITLVSLIKTLDKEQLLIHSKGGHPNLETLERRKMLWTQIVPAFNEICGLDCDAQKLERTLKRIKSTPKWKSHSILYDDDNQ